MDPALNQSGEDAIFDSTVKADRSGSLSMTLSAARSAAGSAGMTKEEKRKRNRKRREKREQRAVAAAEAAAAAAGIDFTGTMKRNVAKDALKALGVGGGDDEYADDAFEADDEDAAYSDDFEADNAAGASSSKQQKSRDGERRSRGRRSKKEKDSPSFEAVTIGNDAGFEATLSGAGRRSNKSSKKSKGHKSEKDAMGETYSRAGLPGRRKHDSDDDDDGRSHLAIPSHDHHYASGGEELPVMSARAVSPRSSTATSHYHSDSNTGPLPNINKRR